MFLDAAFHLTRFGWKIFPLIAGEKIPAIPKSQGGNGCHDATDDENVIASWARKYPQANVGLACGLPSRVIVIDLDPRNGSDASIEALKAKRQTFPQTVTAQTANGGTHFYYAYEPELKNSKSALAPGIDVKAGGGYVVAPPSVLAGGKRYRWLVSPLGESLPRLPRWAAEALKPKPQPVYVPKQMDRPKDIERLIEYFSRTGAGNRNNILFWAAKKAAIEGMLTASAENVFLDAALTLGLEREESLKTIQSAKKYAKLA